jgi:hypothetical protein
MGAENFSGVSAGQRSAKRNRVLLAARLKTSEFGEVDARLRDLSRKGALVETNEVFSVGDEVVFIRGGTIVPARVAWTGGGNRIGLEFLRQIDENEVLIQLGSSKSNQTQQRFRRPALHEGLSDHERKLARVWGVSVGINVTGD